MTGILSTAILSAPAVHDLIMDDPIGSADRNLVAGTAATVTGIVVGVAAKLLGCGWFRSGMFALGGAAVAFAPVVIRSLRSGNTSVDEIVDEAGQSARKKVRSEAKKIESKSKEIQSRAEDARKLADEIHTLPNGQEEDDVPTNQQLGKLKKLREKVDQAIGRVNDSATMARIPHVTVAPYHRNLLEEQEDEKSCVRRALEWEEASMISKLGSIIFEGGKSFVYGIGNVRSHLGDFYGENRKLLRIKNWFADSWDYYTSTAKRYTQDALLLEPKTVHTLKVYAAELERQTRQFAASTALAARRVHRIAEEGPSMGTSQAILAGAAGAAKVLGYAAVTALGYWLGLKAERLSDALSGSSRALLGTAVVLATSSSPTAMKFIYQKLLGGNNEVTANQIAEVAPYLSYLAAMVGGIAMAHGKVSHSWVSTHIAKVEGAPEKFLLGIEEKAKEKIKVLKALLK